MTNQMNFDSLAKAESIENTMNALKENGFLPIHVKSKEEALEKLKELIGKGSTVMNGSSETLKQIGYIEYLKSGKHPWQNLQEDIIKEIDPMKQSLLRRQSVVSDYYVGSAHAVTETGEILIASNTGSQLPHLVFTSPNIILVVGSQKITTSLDKAFQRLQEYVIPLEDKRITALYGMGTIHAKSLILHKEPAMMGRKIHVILVDEKLGF